MLNYPLGKYALTDGNKQIKMDTSMQRLRSAYKDDFENLKLR